MTNIPGSEWHITVPISSSRALDNVRIGDIIYLSGTIYTARDLAHLRIEKYIKEKRELPFSLKNSAIYHAGPIAIKRNEKWFIDVLGPTTSMRMEPYVPIIGRLGAKIMIGKGGMSDKVLNLMKKFKMIYLNAPPGCGIIGAKFITEVQEVYWLDLGMPEAVWKLSVENWGPLIVAIDAGGRNLFSEIKRRAYRNLLKIYP